MGEFTNIALFSSFAGLSTIIGISLIFYREKWAKKNSIYLISFAAGVLLSVSFFHIIPESIELQENAIEAVLVGFLLFYLLEHFTMLHPCHEEACETHTFTRIAVIGLLFHSFLDGVIIAVGFEVSTNLGIIAALGVLLHELPEGATTISICLHENVEKIRAVIYSVSVAIATPIGAISSYFFIHNISNDVLGILLAIAAGSFLYVAATDLVPQMHEEYNKNSAFVLILGIMVLFIFGRLLEH